jgi:hypothetical protein
MLCEITNMVNAGQALDDWALLQAHACLLQARYPPTQKASAHTLTNQWQQNTKQAAAYIKG